MVSNEWYTPAKYIEAAREVIGEIDLDAASCELANQVVQAKRFFTKEQNALVQQWIAENVWLNPPFNGEGKISLKHWVAKFYREHEQGHFLQGILLLPVPMRSCLWYYDLWGYPHCFPRQRIHFWSYQTREAQAGLAYCVIYFGPNEKRFTDVFSKFGHIVRAIDPPKPVTVLHELWQESDQISYTKLVRSGNGTRTKV